MVVGSPGCGGEERQENTRNRLDDHGSLRCEQDINQFIRLGKFWVTQRQTKHILKD